MKKIGRAFLMLLLTMVAGLLLSGFRGEAQEMQETGIDWIYVSPDAGYGQTVVIKFSDIRPSFSGFDISVRLRKCLTKRGGSERHVCRIPD